MGNLDNMQCNFELAGDIIVTGFQTRSTFLKMYIASKTFSVIKSKTRYD